MSRSRVSASPEVEAGHFTLARSRARRGVGEVWFAPDDRIHAQVALKFLPAELRTDAGGKPGARLAAFSVAGIPSIARVMDAVPQSRVTLQSGIAYWLVCSNATSQLIWLLARSRGTEMAYRVKAEKWTNKRAGNSGAFIVMRTRK